MINTSRKKLKRLLNEVSGNAEASDFFDDYINRLTDFEVTDLTLSVCNNMTTACTIPMISYAYQFKSNVFNNLCTTDYDLIKIYTNIDFSNKHYIYDYIRCLRGIINKKVVIKNISVIATIIYELSTQINDDACVTELALLIGDMRTLLDSVSLNVMAVADSEMAMSSIDYLIKPVYASVLDSKYRFAYLMSDKTAYSLIMAMRNKINENKKNIFYSKVLDSVPPFIGIRVIPQKVLMGLMPRIRNDYSEAIFKAKQSFTFKTSAAIIWSKIRDFTNATDATYKAMTEDTVKYLVKINAKLAWHKVFTNVNLSEEFILSNKYRRWINGNLNVIAGNQPINLEFVNRYGLSKKLLKIVLGINEKITDLGLLRKYKSLINFNDMSLNVVNEDVVKEFYEEIDFSTQHMRCLKLTDPEVVCYRKLKYGY